MISYLNIVSHHKPFAILIYDRLTDIYRIFGIRPEPTCEIGSGQDELRSRFIFDIGYTILYIISFLNCEFNPLMYQKFSCKSEFPIKLHIIQHAKLIFPYYAGKYIGVQYSSLNLLKISPLQDPLSNVYMYPVSYIAT